MRSGDCTEGCVSGAFLLHWLGLKICCLPDNTCDIILQPQMMHFCLHQVRHFLGCVCGEMLSCHESALLACRSFSVQRKTFVCSSALTHSGGFPLTWASRKNVIKRFCDCSILSIICTSSVHSSTYVILELCKEHMKSAWTMPLTSHSVIILLTPPGSTSASPA